MFGAKTGFTPLVGTKFPADEVVQTSIALPPAYVQLFWLFQGPTTNARPLANLVRKKVESGGGLVLLGCRLRRRELADLDFTHLQQREEHWARVDLVGKTGQIRTVPVPDWVKTTIDLWLAAATSDADEYRATTKAAAKVFETLVSAEGTRILAVMMNLPCFCIFSAAQCLVEFP